jgi:hypothetical protein
MQNHGASVVAITALCADLRNLTAASILETKELEEIISKCLQIQKEAFHLQKWAMTTLDTVIAQGIEARKQKLARLTD